MERSKGSTAAGVLSEVLKKEGIRGMYKGLGASILGVSHGAVQLLLYEHIKKNIAGNRDPVSYRPVTVLYLYGKAKCLSLMPRKGVPYEYGDNMVQHRFWHKFESKTEVGSHNLLESNF